MNIYTISSQTFHITVHAYSQGHARDLAILKRSEEIRRDGVSALVASILAESDILGARCNLVA